MDDLGSPNTTTKSLVSGRRRPESERFEDATQMALEMEEGATVKEYRQPPESGRGQETDSFLEVLK